MNIKTNQRGIKKVKKRKHICGRGGIALMLVIIIISSFLIFTFLPEYKFQAVFTSGFFPFNLSWVSSTDSGFVLSIVLLLLLSFFLVATYPFNEK